MAAPETSQSLPEEITGSLAAVWKRYTTERPKGGTTEIKGNVVRCVMPGSVEDFATGMSGPPEEGQEPDDLASRLHSYRRDAAVAVARTTQCRVLAQISKHDKQTDVATEIFVLDVEPRLASFGEPGWIVS